MRALGMKESVHVDVVVDGVRAEDVYLVCSDGLSGMVPDDDLLRMVWGEANMDGVCKRLVDLANDNGGQDNITVALARVNGQR